MESGNLDSEHSEDLMLPPHAVRSRRKRGSSKGEADKDNPPKRFCSEETLLKVSSAAISLAESSFIDDLKKESDLVDCGDLKTSTPNGAENLPQKRRKRGSVPIVSLSQLDVSYASEKSQSEETSGDEKSLELSGVTDDSKRLERSGRRNKCTSARVLLGLERPKEITGQPKNRKDKSIDVTSADRWPKVTEPKMKRDVLPKVQREVLSSSLEGLPETPTSLSIERCSVVKPDWLKPFKLGWRREIVFRNTAKNPSSSKQMCDVYYFSSDDTKLRSLPQIVDYLKGVKSTLTGECFTFSKHAIYKEPQEMVRAAAFNRGRLSRRSGLLLSSNESSMKSFDEANDDALSQASSTGTNRQRKVKETPVATRDSCKDDVLDKKETPVLQVVTETPTAPPKLDFKKEEASPDAGGVTPADETDKRQAVRAAATLALRTYMSHALRTVNNPLLMQSGNKDKTALSKSPAKTKSASVQGKHRSSGKTLSPVVQMRRLSSDETGDAGSSSRPEERITRRKGPPSGVNLSKLNAKRLEESYGNSRSKEPVTSKATKLKARSLMSTPATPRPGLLEKSIRDLKKMSPLKKSTPKLSVSAASPAVAATSFEKINAAIKELMSKKDGQQPSPKKLAKSSNQQAALLSAKASSKSKAQMTLPAPPVKILPKPDGKSNEKPALSTERKPSAGPISVVQKPVESSLTETSRLCGMDCPGRLGITPTLPCATCMSLFHPECAGYTSHMYFTPQINFTCWACGKLNKELENTAYGLYKRENQTLEASSSEASSSNLKTDPVLGNSTSNGTNTVDDTNAIALSSLRAQQTSDHGADAAAAAAAATGLEYPQVIHPSISLSGMSIDDISVSCGPSAQLLVIPAALARHLNMLHPLTLLVDDKEVYVKPEQLTMSGVGLNITLPMSSVPDAFVEGPDKPLEFRVVSTAESGRGQAVAVSLFERPLKSSSALKAFSTRKADPTVVPLSDSVGQSASGKADSNESNTITAGPATGVIKDDKDEGNLESSKTMTCLKELEMSMTSDEAKGESVASTMCEGGGDERETMDTTEHLDEKEDLDLEKSEIKAGSSSEESSQKVSEIEHEVLVSQMELTVAKTENESPPETGVTRSSETGKETMETSMEESKADVSVGDSGDHDPCEAETTKSKSPVASPRADENKESIEECEMAAVMGNSSATCCDELHERDGTDTLEGSLLESTELKAELNPSIVTEAMSSTELVAVEDTTAEPVSKG